MAVLTDDEVAAVVVLQGTEWPGALPTISLDEQGVRSAAIRGIHSLVSRGLASLSSTEARVDASIVALVSRACSAQIHTAAYVADSAAPGLLSGSAGYVFSDPNGALIDLVSRGGVHELVEVDAANAGAVISALADNVYRTGIQSSPDKSPALYVLSSSATPEVRRIAKGEVTRGILNGSGALAQFFAGAQQEWNEREFDQFVVGGGMGSAAHSETN